jgi:hypothetical protein
MGHLHDRGKEPWWCAQCTPRYKMSDIQLLEQLVLHPMTISPACTGCRFGAEEGKCTYLGFKLKLILSGACVMLSLRETFSYLI